MGVKLRPINKRIVVRPYAAEEESSGGIIIPPVAQEKTADGEVYALWEPRDWHDDAPDVKVGDHVVFSKYSGTEFAVDGVQFLFIKESDIHGVIG